MFTNIKKLFRNKGDKYSRNRDIAPDEIFLDSKNLPEFDTSQFEGRIEKPISRAVFSGITIFISLVSLVFCYKLFDLQIIRGENFRQRSDSNSLHRTLVFADRGVLYDRNNIPLAWNVVNKLSPDYSLRLYATSTGLSTILGYIKYPTKDSSGIYYQTQFTPKDGLEEILNTELSGINGTKIIEVDVKGNITSESVVEQPVLGENVTLSIDLKLQRKLRQSLLEIQNRAGYKGGAGVIMDVKTGEILAVSNFPEYDSQIMTDGTEAEKIESWVSSKNFPFLNRAISGLYTPGSIMKIFIAMAVLKEGVISPRTQILSTGSITIPNPFFPDQSSIFLDWKAHGLVDLRRAIAVSSNVYFYEVGGGYKEQKGIGILNIEKYSRLFGFGTTTGVEFLGESVGTLPNPDWKKKNFDGEDWRVGDTYNTAIGQYGFQVTPIQAVRGVAALANGGMLVTPTFIKKEKSREEVPEENRLEKGNQKIDLDPHYFEIVKEGMRLGVTEGTSGALNFPFVEVASKTGTAQIGVAKDEVNSWVIGFWPYRDPKYSYAIVMERGSRNNQFGAVLVMQEFLNWVNIYSSEYLK